MGTASLKPVLVTVFIVALSAGVLGQREKIDRYLIEKFERDTYADIFVDCGGTEEVLRTVDSQLFDSREDRINALVAALQLYARTSEQALLNILAQTSLNYTSLWITNQIHIKRATLDLALTLAADSHVTSIFQEGVSHIEAPTIHSVVKLPPGESITANQWGIEKIQAHRVWNTQGNTGSGIVVGIIDTGVRGTHQALRTNYRTPYGWLDPSFVDPNATPDDGNGHGTHCLGSILGSDGIGVAPGAQWVGCKGCRSAFCLNSDLLLCGQFMLCPTLPDGSRENCTKAPHLVSNSWAGGQGNTFFNAVTDAWKVARIIPIFGIGNSGPSCTTALSPADSDVIGVGATDNNDNLASFSSKGPSVLGTLKPDLSAPGVNVYSSYNSADNSYATLSGTSMATPHVAGVVALILSRKGNMTYDEVKTALYRGVETTTLTRCTTTCGNINGTTYPNHCYGRGRLNAYNSVTSIQ